MAQKLTPLERQKRRAVLRIKPSGPVNVRIKQHGSVDTKAGVRAPGGKVTPYKKKRGLVATIGHDISQAGEAVGKTTVKVVNTAYGKGANKPVRVDPNKEPPHATGLLASVHVAPGTANFAPLAAGAKDVVVQTVKHPKKTVQGGAQQITGLVGAAGEVGLPLLDASAHLTGHPKRALKDVEKSGRAVARTGKGMVKDLDRRYGPLFAGNEAAFNKRLAKEGTAAELGDVALAATGGGKAIFTPAARSALSTTAKGRAFLEAPRPKLRVSGGKAVEQKLSPKPTRVVLQRTEDKLRGRKTARQEVKRQMVAQRAVDEPTVQVGSRDRAPALQPVKSPVVKSIERHNAKSGTQVKVPVRESEVVPFSPKLAARRQRIMVSKQAAKSYIGVKHEGAQEINQGAERTLASLSRRQRRATYHVLKGIIPADATPAVARGFIEERMRQLEGAPKAPRVVRRHTEAATLPYLHKHADEIFGDGRLAAFHEAEVARGKRVVKTADGGHTPALRPATAAKQRHLAQGEFLGVKYDPPKPVKVDGKMVDPTPEQTDAYHNDYVKRVQTAAKAKGLSEPTYFPDQERPTVRLGARTGSNVARASKGSKRTKLKLFGEGRAVTNPEVYVSGLAQTIKPKHQWKAVADTADEHAFSWSKGPDGKGLSPKQLEREIDKRGLKREDVSFYSPGQLHGAADGGNAGLEGIVHHASTGLVQSEKYLAVPRGAGRELEGLTTPSGPALRSLARFQGFQSANILGLNPTWAMMQLAANTLQAGVGTGGRLDRIVKSGFRNLSPDHRRIVDQATNVGVYEGSVSAPHMGVHQGAIGRSVESMGQIPLVRTSRGTVRLTDLDPRKIIFRADSLNNNAFRRGVFLNEIRKAQKALEKTSKKLHGDAAEQFQNVLDDPRVVEQAAEATDHILGDYLRYTNRERKIKSAVMFYGFLRYATKTLFYTLPVHHPLTASIAAKLGELHAEEVKAIFNTRDLPPWVYSRSYEYDDKGNLKRDKQGRPMYRDLARINPLTTPITDAVTEGPKAFAGVLSPLAQAAVNWMTNKNVGSGRPLQVHGSAEQQRSLDLTDLARIGLSSQVRSTLPGRVAIGSMTGTQGDDALPLLPDRIRYKTTAAREKDAQRQRDRPTLKQTLLPLNEPRPDTTQAFLNAHGQGPDAAVVKKIKLVQSDLDKIPAGKRRDAYGYETKEYRALLDIKNALVKERARILKTKPRVRVKRRPLPIGEQVRQSVARERKTLRDPAKSVRDEINRLREQAQVNAGR